MRTRRVAQSRSSITGGPNARFHRALRGPPAPDGIFVLALAVSVCVGFSYPIEAWPRDTHSPSAVTLPSEELPPPIVESARRLFSALRLHQVASVEERIEQLVSLRRAALIADLTPVAAAFLARFRLESSALTPEDALRIAQQAVDLAPDFPPLYFNIASLYWTHNPLAVGPMIRAALDGLRAYARYPRGLATLSANLAFRLSLAAAITLVLVAVMLTVRHIRRWVHDIGDLFPAAPSRVFSAAEIARSRRARFITESGLARALAAGVAGLALVLPWSLGFGLVPASLLWTTLVGPYLRRGGETAVAGSCFVFATLIGPLGFVAGLPPTLERTEGSLLWRCAYESCGPRDLGVLEGIVARHPTEPRVVVASVLADIHWAPDDPDVLTAALGRLDASRPDESVSLLRGDVSLMLALSRCDGPSLNRDLLLAARKSFESISETSPWFPDALRGLALTQGLLRDRSGMETTLSRLVLVIPERELGSITPIRTATAVENPCSAVATLRAEIRPRVFPDSGLVWRGFRWSDIVPVLPLEPMLLGRFPLSATIWFGPMMFVIWGIVLRFGRKRDLAFVCGQCGEVTCSACNLRASGFDYCPTCLLEQVRPGFIDPLDLVALRDRREAHSRFSRFIVPALALVIPGSGQILRGRTGRGLVLLGGLALVWSLLTHPLPLHVDVVGFTGPPSGALPVLPPGLLVVIYFLSALDVWADRRR